MHTPVSFGCAALLGGLLLLGGCNADTKDTTANVGGEQPFVGAGGTAADPQTASRPGNEDVATVPGPNDAVGVVNPPAMAPDSLHLLSPGRAGRLRLNMTDDEIRRVIPAARLRKTTRSIKNVSYPAYFVQDATDAAAPPLELEMRGSDAEGYRLWRIRVMDPAYRTGTGVGVGTPFGVARQQYGMSDLEMTDAGLAAASDLIKMAWLLDPSSLPGKSPSTMHSADVPPATRIVGVLLTR